MSVDKDFRGGTYGSKLTQGIEDDATSYCLAKDILKVLIIYLF